MNMRAALLAIVALALASAPVARAAEHDDATLQGDVEALTKMVHDLQRRVSALEAHAPVPVQGPRAAKAAPNAIQPAPQSTQATAPPAPQAAQAAAQPAAVMPSRAAPITAAQPGANPGYLSPEATLKASWNQIEKGMDQVAIKTLLGTPSTTFLLDGRLVWYYYYPGTGRGSVFFTDAGQVSSYQSPLPGFGW